MGKRTTAVAGALVLLLLASTAVEAQRRSSRRDYGQREPVVAGYLGLTFVAADPVGQFGRLVEEGYGVELEGGYSITPEGALLFRGDLGLIVYGHERDGVCFGQPIGCRLSGDLVTDNAIFFMGFGPEVTMRAGPLRPYVNATAGFSYFFTRTSLQDDRHGDDHFTTQHMDDFVTALTLGGGLRARLSRGRHPVFLDFGARYHRNGVAEYLREGDIVDHPDGSITLYPNRTEANLVSYRIGVSVGFPRGNDRAGRR